MILSGLRPLAALRPLPPRPSIPSQDFLGVKYFVGVNFEGFSNLPPKKSPKQKPPNLGVKPPEKKGMRQTSGRLPPHGKSYPEIRQIVSGQCFFSKPGKVRVYDRLCGTTEHQCHMGRGI